MSSLNPNSTIKHNSTFFIYASPDPYPPSIELSIQHNHPRYDGFKQYIGRLKYRLKQRGKMYYYFQHAGDPTSTFNDVLGNLQKVFPNEKWEIVDYKPGIFGLYGGEQYDDFLKVYKVEPRVEN
jgi:hypothetical protein